MSNDLFAPPSADEIAQAAPPAADLFGPPTTDELHAAAPKTLAPLDSLAPKIMSELEGGAGVNPGAHIPVLGPAMIKAGHAFAAGLGAITPDAMLGPQAKGKSFGDLYDQLEQDEAAKQQAFAKAHPGANTAQDVLGAAALPMPPVLQAGQDASLLAKAGTALGNSALRLGSNTAIQAADAVARGKDPKEAASRAAVLGGLVEGGTLGLQGISALADAPAVQTGAKKVLSALGGVSTQNISRYLEDPEAIKAAQKIPLSEIKDLVDTDLAKIDAGVQDTRIAHADALGRQEDLQGQLGDAFDNVRARISGKVGDAKDALRDAYAQELQDLRDQSVPLDMAKRLSASLGEQKKALGAMSQEAEEALAQTPGAVSRDDLRGLLRNVAGDIGARGANGERHLIGEEASSAVQSLHSLDQRLAALPDQVPFGTARDIMRQVRADVKNAGGYSMGAGEFNGTLNNAKKAFVGSISDYLKIQSPDYKAKMAEMAPLSQSLERMNQLYGDPDQALVSLAAAAKGAGPRGQIASDALQTHAQLTGNTAPLDELAQYANASRILASPPLRQQLLESLPEYRQLQRAQAALAQFAPAATDRAGQLMVQASPVSGEVAQTGANLADAQALRGQFAGWSPGTTEGRLKNATANTQNPDRGIEAGRSLDALSAFNGQNNYRQMLADKATGDSFQRGFSHGSRNVNLWSMIGRLFGGQAVHEPEMRAAGASFGAMIDAFGPQMTQQGLNTFMAVRDKIGPWLGPLMEAAKQGPQSLAVTHYLLMQQDPKYQAVVGGQGAAP